VINASSFVGSITDKHCKLFIDNLDGPEYSRIDLRDERIPIHNGHWDETPNATLRALRKRVLDCDGMFIATPVHWFNVPSVLKAFIDHLTPIESKLWKRERLLGIAVYAPEGGELGAFSAVVCPLTLMGFSLVGSGFVYRREKRKPKAWVRKDIVDMAERFSE
jgi:NAD(P)H-dependent FMN reductase